MYEDIFELVTIAAQKRNPLQRRIVTPLALS